MASLFEHLSETMPFAGVLGAMEANAIDINKCSGDEIKRFLRYILPGEPYVASVPQLDKKADPTVQGIWGWTYDPAEPASVSSIWCRVRNADYKPQKVLDRLSFGLEDPIGNFRNSIRITTTCDFAVELPLKADFLVDRWVAIAGYLEEDATHLWPLKALHDRSLVLAFVFDLDENGDPKPMPKDAARENLLKQASGPLKPEHEEASALGPSTFSDIAPQAPLWSRESSDPIDLNVDEGQLDDGSKPVSSGEEPWFKQINKDDFMPLDHPKADVSGDIGSTCPATTGAARVLVVLTLTVARERSTYDAAGVNGVGKLYPHILVKASVPLRKIEASIQFDRPETTTRGRESNNPDDSETMGCCRGHDVSDDTINSLLVADANTNDSPFAAVAPPFPFWCNLFNYYQVDAYQVLGTERLHVVRRDRPDARVDDSGWVVRKTVTGSDSKEVRKEPRQGEFDNIHMAPKLKMVNVKWMTFSDSMLDAVDQSKRLYPIDREAMRLDDITMAPFCAHDCFHLHWRWSKIATDKFVMGWDKAGPHRVAGAPMVPLNQDVDIWLRGKNQLTYHAIVGPDDEELDQITSHTWQVIAHHGAGYALFFTDYMSKFMVEHAFDLLAPPPYFLDADKNMIKAEDSTSLFFWWCRFSANDDLDRKTYAIVERTLSWNLKAARDL